MRTIHAIALIAGLTLAGCAGLGTQRTATQESLITATATVQSVDQATRRVTLRDDADGRVFTVVAGPEVRNLAQLAAGDTVQMDYYSSTTLAMASPEDTGEPAGAIVTGRAPEGALPGGLAVATTSMVVTLLNYDASNRLATFRTPDGVTRRATVPPNFQTFAASLTPGARVAVTLTDAVAVTITETAAS
jgi:hypothetical protein